MRHKPHKNWEIGFLPRIEVQDKYAYPDGMMGQRIHNRICKACALTAATLILPVLAHAQSTATTNPPTVSPRPVAVPEGGPGIALLIPTFGAILILSARQFSRRRKA